MLLKIKHNTNINHIISNMAPEFQLMLYLL